MKRREENTFAILVEKLVFFSTVKKVIIIKMNNDLLPINSRLKIIKYIHVEKQT